MRDEIPVLHCKLKRYERKSKQKSKDGKERINRRYMIPVKKDQIEGTKFQEVDDIIILSKEDFEYESQKSKVIGLSHENLKKSLNDKEEQIKSLKEQIYQIDANESYITNLRDKLTKEFQLKFEDMVYKHKIKVNTLNDEIKELNKIKDDYKSLDNHNKELERELKRLRDLRILEKQSFQNRIDEIELNKDEYDKLRKSHEFLWDVVQEKERIIKDLEKRGIINNLINKIKK